MLLTVNAPGFVSLAVTRMISWIKEIGGGAPREPLSHYYIANPEVIRLSLAIAGLEKFFIVMPPKSPSAENLLDAARGWFHAFPGYATSEREVTGVLLSLDWLEIAELRSFADRVEGAILCAGLKVPCLMPEPMLDRIQKRGEKLRWDLSRAVQQSRKLLRRDTKALGVFASNHEVWSLHIAVNALKVLVSKRKPDFETKHFLFDLESGLIRAGRPDQALKGVALDFSVEEKEMLQKAASAVWSLARSVVEKVPTSHPARWERELDAANALIEEAESLLVERLARDRR